MIFQEEVRTPCPPLDPRMEFNVAVRLEFRILKICDYGDEITNELPTPPANAIILYIYFWD